LSAVSLKLLMLRWWHTPGFTGSLKGSDVFLLLNHLLYSFPFFFFLFWQKCAHPP
jgi:hypothetical protein